MIPIPWKTVGVAAVLLALIAACLWGAVRLVEMGRANAELAGEVATLQAERAQLQEAAATLRGQVDSLAFLAENCRVSLEMAEEQARRWKERYAARPVRIRRVAVEIEATQCVEALIESRTEAALAVETVVSDASP